MIRDHLELLGVQLDRNEIRRANPGRNRFEDFGGERFSDEMAVTKTFRSA